MKRWKEEVRSNNWPINVLTFHCWIRYRVHCCDKILNFDPIIPRGYRADLFLK
jgi:hypothetical protein